MGILSWVGVGLIVGFLASGLLKRRGISRLNIVFFSVVGAVLGGLDVAVLYQVPGAIYGLNGTGMIVALAGALVAIALFQLLTPQKSAAV